MLLSETKMRALLLLARGGCHKFRRSGFPEISEATLTALVSDRLVYSSFHYDHDDVRHEYVRVTQKGKALVDAYRMGRKGVV